VTLLVFVALFVVALWYVVRPRKPRVWWVTLRRGQCWKEAVP
jgi:hypothetical protein